MQLLNFFNDWKIFKLNIYIVLGIIIFLLKDSWIQKQESKYYENTTIQLNENIGFNSCSVILSTVVGIISKTTSTSEQYGKHFNWRETKLYLKQISKRNSEIVVMLGLL